MTIADRQRLITQPLITAEEAAIVPKAHQFFQDYQLLHSLEGRWRVKINRLCYDTDYASNLVGLLGDSNFILEVRCNEAASSLIIEYNPDDISLDRLREYILISMEEADHGDLAPAKASSEQFSHEINYWERLGIPAASLVLAIVALPLELPPLLVGGLILAACLPAYWRAWEGISEEQQLTVDFLDSLAITLSAAQGHFIPPAFMISLIESGEVIRDVTARSSERQTLDLLDSLGKYAWIEREGVEVQVPLKEVEAGNIVIVYPGDLISIDGKIIRGQGLIDQQKLTGESVPVHREIDDEVYASTLVSTWTKLIVH